MLHHHSANEYQHFFATTCQFEPKMVAFVLELSPEKQAVRVSHPDRQRPPNFPVAAVLESQHNPTSETSGALGIRLTHEVHDQLAHPGAEDEVPHQVGDEGEGDADDGDHQVADGQRQQEQVGDRPHAPVPHQHRDDQAVAQHAEEEDEAVEDDPDRLVDVCRRTRA